MEKLDIINRVVEIIIAIIGIILYSDYKGKTYYSEDWGDTWKYLCTDGNTKSKVIGFDADRRRYYFGEYRGRQTIVEVNP